VYRQRQLDDEDLDSGDDIGRSDRIQREANEAEPETVTDDYNVIDVDFPRHPIPELSDGEVFIRSSSIFTMLTIRIELPPQSPSIR
jgi:RNA polymerase-associated protein LEO1